MIPDRSTKEANSAAASTHGQRMALAERLTNAIASAILAPGHLLTLAQLAKHLRSTPEQTEAILPAFVSSGLLSIENGSIRIAPIERDKILPGLAERLSLEQGIARAAVMRATDDDHSQMRHALQLMKRCAQVGDIDGYMGADRILERIIGAASGLPAEVEKLVAIKREFRRAWFAYNRLRDLNIPIGMRSRLVEAILAKDPDAASAAVEIFIDYLKASY